MTGRIWSNKYRAASIDFIQVTSGTKLEGSGTCSPQANVQQFLGPQDVSMMQRQLASKRLEMVVFLLFLPALEPKALKSSLPTHRVPRWTKNEPRPLWHEKATHSPPPLVYCDDP